MTTSTGGSTSDALLPFPHMAGMASSTLIFTQMALSTGFNITYSMLVSPGTVALAAGMFMPITFALLLAIFVATRVRRAEAEAADAVAQAEPQAVG